MTLPLLCILLALGAWQIQRGQAKAAIIAEREAAGKMPPLSLAEVLARPGASAAGRLVAASGRYLADRQLLLDNQVWQGRPGYRVWTPLRLEDTDRLVMVDRGWVALGTDRAQPPDPAAPAGALAVRGYWRDWPRPGLRLKNSGACEADAWPRVVQYPAFGQVACHFQTPVADGLLLLSENAPGGFPRDWRQLGMPPIRHYGYAVQWFALALALVIIFLIMNGKRKT